MLDATATDAPQVLCTLMDIHGIRIAGSVNPYS